MNCLRHIIMLNVSFIYPSCKCKDRSADDTSLTLSRVCLYLTGRGHLISRSNFTAIIASMFLSMESCRLSCFINLCHFSEINDGSYFVMMLQCSRAYEDGDHRPVFVYDVCFII